MTDVRLRFAPSPTGPLHLGGARTALYNWAAARAMGGRFLLRIEDTDRARSTEESLAIILQGLRWLGLDWDEGPDQGGDHGPYFQSQRQDLYRGMADQLLESGHAYRCYCTPEEVEEGRKNRQAQGLNPVYDRRCRDLDGSQQQGRPFSLRYRMPLQGTWTCHDLIRGEVVLDLAELDDWVMLRVDGTPLYNFACVVDDSHMGITHVVRGDEHFINGVKQQVLFDALGVTAPAYAHIPLILNAAGKKLSKRDAAVNVLDYRDQGYPPEAVFNYIALLGWGFSGDRDVFTREEMVERFRLQDVGKSGARFDEEKLAWMCGDYIRRTPLAELVGRVRPHLEACGVVPEEAFSSHPHWLANAVACEQERIRLYTDLPPRLGYLFAEDLQLDDGARKNLRKHEESGTWLRRYRELLAASSIPPSYPRDRGDIDRLVRLPSAADREVPGDLPHSSPAQLEQQARDLAVELGIKFGQLVHPVRAALTGTTKGPGLFDIAFLLGKETCLQRLDQQCASG
jgi:glutamyl-tRNA synthetase